MANNEKTLNSRFQQKHDIEANWIKATNFIPKEGEIIVYDVDDTHTKQRIKIGDGATLVNKLPFAGVGELTESGGEIFNDYKNNTARSPYSKAVGRNATAGIFGYRIKQISNGNLITLDDATLGENRAINHYIIGDEICNDCFQHNYNEYKIIEINLVNEETTITVARVDENNTTPPALQLFEGEWDEQGTLIRPVTDYDNWVYVVAKPLAGVPAVVSTGAYAGGSNTLAIGTGAYAHGDETIAIGNYAHAEGWKTTATLTAHAEGYETMAKGKHSHTEGVQTETKGSGAHAEGKLTQANGQYSHAEGQQTKALGGQSHAEGYLSEAIGSNSHAEGRGSKAQGQNSHAEGNSSNTGENAVAAHAEGQTTQALGKRSHAEGLATQAIGDESHSEGKQTQAIGLQSHAEGVGTIAQGDQQHVSGRWNEIDTNNQYACVVGNGTKEDKYDDEGNLITKNRRNIYALDWDGSGHYSGTVYIGEEQQEVATQVYVNEVVDAETAEIRNAAVGQKAKGGEIFNNYTNNRYSAVGNHSHVEGSSTNVVPNISGLTNDEIVAQWQDTPFSLAKGGNSHIEGINNLAFGNEAHAEGRTTQAIGNYSHAEGVDTKATGTYSHAEGKSSRAAGVSAHAEGQGTSAAGDQSHTEGLNTQTKAQAAHAEGKGSIAEADYSHAEGWSTQANGVASHAEGKGSKAVGEQSHAEGVGTVAQANFQHVQGQFNIIDTNGDYAHIVGWGASNSDRKNIHTLSTGGNAWFAGKATVGAEPTDDMDVATKKYVDDATGVIDVYSLPTTDIITGSLYRLQSCIIVEGYTGGKLFDCVVVEHLPTNGTTFLEGVVYYQLSDKKVYGYTDKHIVNTEVGEPQELSAGWHYIDAILNYMYFNGEFFVGMTDNWSEIISEENAFGAYYGYWYPSGLYYYDKNNACFMELSDRPTKEYVDTTIAKNSCSIQIITWEEDD